MPLFQKRHYVAMAKHLHDNGYNGEGSRTSRVIADLFAMDNPKFQRDRFMLACAGKVLPNPYDYRGYRLHVSAEDHIVTVVAPPGFVLRRLASLDLAMRWVDNFLIAMRDDELESSEDRGQANER